MCRSETAKAGCPVLLLRGGTGYSGQAGSRSSLIAWLLPLLLTRTRASSPTHQKPWLGLNTPQLQVHLIWLTSNIGTPGVIRHLWSTASMKSSHRASQESAHERKVNTRATPVPAQGPAWKGPRESGEKALPSEMRRQVHWKGNAFKMNNQFVGIKGIILRYSLKRLKFKPTYFT